MEPGSLTIHRDAFVGREPEIDQLSAQLNRTLSGYPKIVMLTGEAGVGKTRLLREFSGMARRLGMRVMHGRAMEDSSTPYFSFLNVLEACARDTKLDGHAADEFALFRGQDHGTGLLAAPANDVGYDRVRLFVAVIRQILTFARREPLLIVLDDMHWADAPSLELLAQLVFVVTDDAANERLPLLVICAHRPVPVNHRLNKLKDRLKRESAVTSLELGGFAAAETGAFLVGLGIQRAGNQLIEAVHRLTHGHPLFIQEMLHQLERHGLLVETAGYTNVKSTPPHLELPRDVKSALAERLASLDEHDVLTLTLAALIGDEFDPERIVKIPGGERGAVFSALEHAIDAELLVLDGQTYRFRHPLIRELLAGRASGANLQALHLQIARALETEDPSGALSIEIANHLIASSSGDARRVLHHAERGAAHAFSLFAWAEAGRLYKAAAEVAAGLTDLTLGDIGELHRKSGLAYQHDCDFGASLDQYSAAVHAFARAGDLRGQAKTLCHRTRVQAISATVSYGEVIDLSEQEHVLWELAEREPQIRGGLMDVISQAHWTARRTELAEEMARRALAIGEVSADAALRMDSSFSLGLALFQGGRLRDAFAAYSSSLQLAIELGDPWNRLAPMQRLSILHISFGDLAAAQALAEEARVLAAQVYHMAEASFVAANLASIALARGDSDDVHERTREAVQLAQRARYPWSAMIALSALTWARALEGRHADAQHAIGLLGKPGEIFETPGLTVSFMVALWKAFLDLHAETKPTADAARRFAQLMPGLERAPFDANAAGVLCIAVEGAYLLERASLVAVAHERLERMYRDGMVLTASPVFSLERVLGLSSRLLGRPDDAERYLCDAIATTERLGARAELARSLLDRAQLLVRDAQPERAAEPLRRAHGLCGELGLAHDTARALRLAEKCGLSFEAPASSSFAGALDERETLLLRRIAQGRAYPEIANELLIDPGSVAARADHVFAKIGVNGPSLATAYAFAHGLVGPDSVAPPGPTVLMVTDMVDFTGLVERVGDLHARTIMHIHNRLIRRLLAEHSGKEVTHTGDGLMASFRSGEDATACAASIQIQLAAYCREHTDTSIRVRIGLNAGYVLPEEDRLFGAALIAAVRICSRASAGQVLMSESVLAMCKSGGRRHTRPLGSVTLKGFADAVPIHELLFDSSEFEH